MTIYFDDDYDLYPNVKDMIKITNTLKPGSKACWGISYNEIALSIYFSSPHVQVEYYSDNYSN